MREHGTSVHANVIRKGKQNFLEMIEQEVFRSQPKGLNLLLLLLMLLLRLGCSPVLFGRGEGLAAILLDPAKIM